MVAQINVTMINVNKRHSYRSGTRSPEGAENMQHIYAKLRLCMHNRSRKRCFSDVWPIFWPWRWYTFPIKFGHVVDRVISFPTVSRTSKSMQPFRKYSRLKVAHLRQSRGFTKIGVKSVIMHRARKLFTDVFQTYVQTTSSLEVFDRKNFTTEFYHLKVVKPIYHVFFHVFDPQNRGKGSSWGAKFGVVGKPIPTFLIAVYWSHFDISVRFHTNRLNIAKKTRFSSGGSLRR